MYMFFISFFFLYILYLIKELLVSLLIFYYVYWKENIFNDIFGDWYVFNVDNGIDIVKRFKIKWIKILKVNYF